MVKKSRTKIFPSADILNLDIFQRECHRPLPLNPGYKFGHKLPGYKFGRKLPGYKFGRKTWIWEGGGGDYTHAEKYRDSGC